MTVPLVFRNSAPEDLVIRTILVPATGDDVDSTVFAAALDVARRFGAHLDVLHVRTDVAEIAAAFVADGGGGMVSAGLIDQLEEEARQRAEKAHKFFQVFCARETLTSGPGGQGGVTTTAAWHEEVGREAHWVVDYGRTSDLLVIGRPVENRGVSETLEAALMGSGRPLLIPGPAPAEPGTTAIAWKSTREAARAVSLAMPLLEQAKRIVILTLAEDDRAERDSAARLLETLQRHGVAGEVRYLQPSSRSTAETLLASASEIGAGLLVMGGYGHSRLREMVFGGVTEHVLQAAAVPVLMAH